MKSSEVYCTCVPWDAPLQTFFYCKLFILAQGGKKVNYDIVEVLNWFKV